MPNEQEAVPVRQEDDLAALRSACVKVTSDGSVGTGYFVAPGRVVTCEHVVRKVKKDSPVTLTLSEGTALEAFVEHTDASTDVAILRLPPGAPSIKPLKVTGQVKRNQPFTLVGFPQRMEGQPLVLTGYVHDHLGQDKRGASALVLYSHMVAAGQGALMHGYSGSPVVVGGVVVGHLGRVLTGLEAERPLAEMGLVFATPGREVLRLLQGDAPPVAAPLPAQPPGAPYSPHWYVPRPCCERRALAYLESPGSPAVLYGPRQSGKSWLLTYLVNAWRQQHPQGAVARVNLLEFANLDTLEDFTAQLAYKLMDELNGEETWLGTYERDKGRATPIIRLGRMLKQHVLGRGSLTLLAIDATDSILGRPYANSFFGALRAWMDQQSHPCDQLRLLMAISTTPSRLISDGNQSPFNLNAPVVVPPLTPEEVGQLAQRHGLEFTARELAELCALTGGHPYLVRRVLFDATLADGGSGALALDANSEVFAPHLRSLLHFVRRESLGEQLSAVLRNPAAVVSPDQEELLKKAWLVRRTAEGRLEPTCSLHREYFTRELHKGVPG